MARVFNPWTDQLVDQTPVLVWENQVSLPDISGAEDELSVLPAIQVDHNARMHHPDLRPMLVTFVTTMIMVLLLPRHSFPLWIRAIGAFCGFGGVLYAVWWAYRSRNSN